MIITIYNFPDKKKKVNTGKSIKPMTSIIVSKQDDPDSLVNKILRLANEYDPKNDPAIKAFKRRIRY